jgi:hypothetical protein
MPSGEVMLDLKAALEKLILPEGELEVFLCSPGEESQG